MTTEFETRELQQHVRERLKWQWVDEACRVTIVFLYGVATGLVLAFLILNK